jgi:hypothetical protein
MVERWLTRLIICKLKVKIQNSKVKSQKFEPGGKLKQSSLNLLTSNLSPVVLSQKSKLKSACPSGKFKSSFSISNTSLIIVKFLFIFQLNFRID